MNGNVWWLTDLSGEVEPLVSVILLSYSQPINEHICK